MTSSLGIAKELKARLSEVFSGFDSILRSGDYKRTPGHPQNDDMVTGYMVAGYDGMQPHVSEVTVEVDWARNTHLVGPVKPLYPASVPHNISIFVVGHRDAIEEVWNTSSSTNTALKAGFPAEYRAIARDEDLDLAHMASLARALIALQIKRTPDRVSFPVSVMTIRPSGPIETHTFDR